ncbi:MAG TPA: HDOD domain-containing protein [Acidiferrobacteraceae bacterium]|nr:HDOD domain-containing protein [Acidiferrobacteraceae bacterium]
MSSSEAPLQGAGSPGSNLASNLLLGLNGFYVLTGKGQLSLLDSTQGVVADPQRSKQFQDIIAQFLKLRAAGAEDSGVLLGIVYQASGKQAWRSPTLAFDLSVLHLLYPQPGRHSEGLTAFQKRNRFKSIYQGAELLLNHRNEGDPDVPIYCPLLMNPGRNLAAYSKWLGAETQDEVSQAPVLEMVNLLAPMSQAQRRDTQFKSLVHSIHTNVVKLDVRRESDLALVDDFFAASDGGVDVDVDWGVDKRVDSEGGIKDTGKGGSNTVKSETDHAPKTKPFIRVKPIKQGPDEVTIVLTVGTHLDAEVLRQFDDFHTLSERQMDLLTAKASVRQTRVGQHIIEMNSSDRWNYYLIEGELELESDDNDNVTVSAGSLTSRHGIAHLVPRLYDVYTLTTVIILRVHDALLHRLRADDLSNAAAPINIGDLGRLQDTGLVRELLVDIENERLVLPSCPDIAMRVRRSAAQETSDAATIARVVQADPAIAVKIVRAANSAFYRGNSPVESCSAAIVRLGTETTRKLVTTFAMREVFQTDNPLLMKHMKSLLQHSTEVAAICQVLARLTPGLDSEEALLAGLLHDIGVAPILGYAARHQEVGRDEKHVTAILEHMRGQIGGTILSRWGFADDFVTCALEADEWYRDPSEHPDYCDLVIIAQLHSAVGTPGDASYPKMHDLPAFEKLALGKLTPGLSLEILHEARDQIAETQRLLLS